MKALKTSCNYYNMMNKAGLVPVFVETSHSFLVYLFYRSFYKMFHSLITKTIQFFAFLIIAIEKIDNIVFVLISFSAFN